MVQIVYVGDGENVRAEHIRFVKDIPQQIDEKTAKKIAEYPGFVVSGAKKPRYDYDYLKAMNRDDQISLLKSKGVKGYSKMDEEELIQKIMEVQ